MKKSVLAFLALAAALPARSASPEFKVELFSRRGVHALTVEAAAQSVSICGSKTDGPCHVLLPSRRITCVAARLIQCRIGETNRNFTFLTVDSTAPFCLTPIFAKMNEPQQTLLIRNARVMSTRGNLRVITQVNLESYVAGVLRGEASVLEAPAARQAMAIVARTWALRWQGRHRGQGFDFCSLTHCQVFRLPLERREDPQNGLDPAAGATRGQVLRYHGALADPYFTACCGGVTEAAGSIWPDRTQAYLISIHDPFCLSSNHASWNKALSGDSVQEILREALHLPTAIPLTELSVEERDPSGRALILRAVAGATWKVNANQFRYAVDRRFGWEQIKSNLYTIQRRGDSWVFSGRGLGHGVGLCQAGAEQMARLGSSTEQILSTYFPGTEIGSRPSLDPDPVASSEHFELVYPASQESWVKQTLDGLELWRKELGRHAEILPPRTRVQTWASMGEFINATGEPGWMAASSNGQSIILEPLDLLARKHLLTQTLRHELTHLVVHRLRANGVPRWFEEGWVLYLTGERIATPATALMTAGELEAAITQPHSETEMKTAYAQALERVRQFARREGDAAPWRVLEHPTASDLHWLHEG